MLSFTASFNASFSHNEERVEEKGRSGGDVDVRGRQEASIDGMGVEDEEDDEEEEDEGGAGDSSDEDSDDGLTQIPPLASPPVGEGGGTITPDVILGGGGEDPFGLGEEGAGGSGVEEGVWVPSFEDGEDSGERGANGFFPAFGEFDKV